MRCQARSREDRRSPWINCQREATHLLVHRSKMKAYCFDDAQRFVEVFPRGTFREVKIGGSNANS